MPVSGRTVAVVGLDRQEMLDLTAALEDAGLRWQAFSDPDATAVKRAHLIIARAAVAARFAATKLPLLVIGTLDEIKPFAQQSSLPRDFSVASPMNAGEIVLRATHLLADHRYQHGTAATSRPLVLAVDDDPTTTAIVSAIVTQHGMTCQIAADGRSALDLAQSIHPSVIVLDVNMPQLDGFQVLSALRSEPLTATVAIMMLTSLQHETDIVRAFALGADDYVVKPFNPMELLARIQRLVKRQT